MPGVNSARRLQAGYLQLFEHYPLPMLVVHRDSLRLLAANEAAAQCYGYTTAHLTRLYLPDLYFDADQTYVPTFMALAATELQRSRTHLHKGQGARAIEVQLDFEDMALHGTPARVLLLRDVTLERAAKRARQANAPHLPGAVQTIADGFFTLDTEARITYANPMAEALLQVSRAQLVGKTLWECCPQAACAENVTQFRQLVQAQQAICFEFFHERHQMWLEVRAFACSQAVAVHFRDVTLQRQEHAQLAQEQQRLKAIVDACSDAIITMDTSGRIQALNPGAERVFGVGSAAAMGQPVDTLLPHSRLLQAAQAQDPRAPAAEGALTHLHQITGVTAQGRTLHLEGFLTHVTQDQAPVLMAILRDVTQRERADAERQHARAQLSHLARRLMVQEKDLVKRIAQALHDQLGQTMAAIRIIHETLIVLRQGKSSREQLRLDQQLGRLIDQANQQVRQVLVDLHPPLLDEHGLAAALDNELRGRALRQRQMDFVLQVPPDTMDMRWPSAVEYCAFMIAREAIENALRHAKATQVSVNLRGDPQQLVLDVTDNGHGIAPDSLTKAGHLGITGMLERAHSIGSVVTVSPAESGGTLVRLCWSQTP